LEHLCDLLFEVSNEDRLRILQRLRGEAMNVTSLSRERPALRSRTRRASTTSPPTGLSS